MRIVLKPLGAIAIVGAILLLSLLAFRNKGLKNTTPDGAIGSVASTSVKSENVATGAVLKVYENGLENGWQERGWAKVMNYADAGQVRGGGGTAIRVEAAPYEGIKMYNATADLSPYQHLVLFAHGGDVGGQSLTVTTVAGGKTQKPVALSPLPAGKWVRIAVPLAELGIKGRRDVNAFWLQNASDNQAVFHLDDIHFRATAPDTVSEETLALLPAAQTATTP